MKRTLCLALLGWPLPAHVMSMSSGDLAIVGARANYELRMPLYEVAHVPNPERALLEHIRFTGARLRSRRTWFAFSQVASSPTRQMRPRFPPSS